MTPMIDVVFLLIIFFLVSSHLARSEAQMPLSLPEATTGDQVDEQLRRVVVNVDAQGEYHLAGRLIQGDSLQPLMSAVVAEKGDAVQLHIRAAQEVEYAQISPIIAAAAKSGIWDVNFTVIPVE